MKQKLKRRCQLELEYQKLLNLAEICRNELQSIDKTLNIFDPKYNSLTQYKSQLKPQKETLITATLSQLEAS